MIRHLIFAPSVAFALALLSSPLALSYGSEKAYSSSQTACARKFTEFDAGNGNPLKDWLKTIPAKEYPREPTVIDSNEPMILHGHALKAIERVGSVWESAYESVPNGLQGDPRNFIIALGPESAEHFGFKMLSDKKMLAPSAEGLNAAIDAVNQRLAATGRRSKAFGFRFYTPANPHLSDRDFVVGFLNLKLPIAKDGPLYIHDISAHSLSFLIPNRFLKHAQAQSKFIVDFEEFVRDHHPELAKSKLAQELFEALYADAASRLDLGTGNFGINLGRNSIGIASRRLETLTQYGMSPYRLVGNTVEDFVWEEEFPPEARHALSQAWAEFSLPRRDELLNMTEDMEGAEKEVQERLATLQKAVGALHGGGAR